MFNYLWKDPVEWTHRECNTTVKTEEPIEPKAQREVGCGWRDTPITGGQGTGILWKCSGLMASVSSESRRRRQKLWAKAHKTWSGVGTEWLVIVDSRGESGWAIKGTHMRVWLWIFCATTVSHCVDFSSCTSGKAENQVTSFALVHVRKRRTRKEQGEKSGSEDDN